MKFDTRTLTALALYSVRNPKDGAARLLGLGLTRDVVWPLMLLVAVVSTLLFAIQNAILPPPEARVTLSPVGAAVLAVASMIAIASSIHLIGRLLGGAGRFWDAVLLITWMQAILIVLQLLQSLVSFFTAAFGGLFLVAGLGLTLWLLINFTAVLHGYSSRAKAFGVVILAFFATGLTLALLFGLAGVGG